MSGIPSAGDTGSLILNPVSMIKVTSHAKRGLLILTLQLVPLRTIQVVFDRLPEVRQ